MEFKVVRAVRANLPALKMPVELLEKIGKIGEGSILQNIKDQKQASGQALERNSPRTLEIKRRKGRPLKSLVDQFHRFTRGRGQSWATQIEPHRNWVIIEPATQELRKLSEWLQKGMQASRKRGGGRRTGPRKKARPIAPPLPKSDGKKRRYTGWFGLSERAAMGIREITRAWVRAEFEKARRKQGST